jgi:hypothetical protein
MSTQDTPSWLSGDRLITNRQKREFIQRYRTELGFEEDKRLATPSEKVSDQIFLLLSGGKNWNLWMPENSVTRLTESKNRYDEIKTIVSETANNLPVEVELEPVDYYILFDNILTRINGSTDFDHKKVRSEDFEPALRNGNTTYDDMPIIIKSINSKNLEDWYVYIVSDASQLFGDEIHSMTQAARSIFQAGLEPAHVVRNIGFHLEDSTRGRDCSVPGVAAPTESVTIVENTNYWQIDTPRQAFGDSWGSVEEMRSILGKNHQSARFCTNDVGYWVSTGANG